MRFVVALSLIVITLGILAVGCGSEEVSPTPSPTPASTTTATPSPTPAPTPSAENEAWTARYNGPPGSADWAFALTVDKSGNVYVTGKSYSGGFYDYSMTTIKYDGNGTSLWVSRYDGPGGDDDVGHAIALDGSGNVYVTGKSYNGNHTDYAYATVKYNNSGVRSWASRYDGAGTDDDIAQAIAVDSQGNVYVTGTSGGDYATLKYDSSGNQRWVARYDGPEGSDDEAVAIGLDGSGNVYVAGTSGSDFATVKYDSSGKQLWDARFEGGAGDMAVDSQGNVYVTGTSRGGNYLTIKYDTAGTRLWTAGFSGPLRGDGDAKAITLDASGNVYITGKSLSPRIFAYSYATVKYDSEGKQLWAARYDGVPPYGSGWAEDIAVDGSGNVYVTGSMKLTESAWDYVTVGYDSSGKELWAARYDSPARSYDPAAAKPYDQAAAIAVDGQGNIYVTGRSDGGRTNADFLTIKYTPMD